MNHIRLFKHYINIHYVVLGVIEYFLITISVYLGVVLRFWSEPEDVAQNVEHLLPRALLFSSVMLVSMIAMGVYQSRFKEGLTGMTLRTVVAFFLLGAIVLSALFYFAPSLELFLGRGILALSSIIALTLVTALRLFFYKSVGDQILKKRVLVIGAGKQARKLKSLFDDAIEQNVFLMGFVPVKNGKCIIDNELLVEVNTTLLRFVLDNSIDEIVVAVDDRRRSVGETYQFPLEELLDCKLSGIAVIDVLSFIEREAGKIDVRALQPSWLVFSDGFVHSALRDYTQRTFDLIASLMLLLVAWPLMLLTAVAIKLEDGFRAHLFYSQERVGLNGKIFKVHKFRSMCIDAEKDGQAVWAQKNDSRVTRVGAFIRNTRIDELPQIFNVLSGDMSFVGPRPERPQFVEQLSKKIPYFDERHRVKPGITGWAQLCYPYGASDEDAEQKLQYDLYYIKNRSLLLDLVILVQTVEVILIGKGVR